ncbi:MAG TPA: hypothetical protein VJN02_01500 [Gammaproteobacteria bacterium]|nr:hypothetical protein [Gammaproteobacteria bacterium]
MLSKASTGVSVVVVKKLPSVEQNNKPTIKKYRLSCNEPHSDEMKELFERFEGVIYRQEDEILLHLNSLYRKIGQSHMNKKKLIATITYSWDQHHQQATSDANKHSQDSSMSEEKTKKETPTNKEIYIFYYEDPKNAKKRYLKSLDSKKRLDVLYLQAMACILNKLAQQLRQLGEKETISEKTLVDAIKYQIDEYMRKTQCDNLYDNLIDNDYYDLATALRRTKIVFDKFEEPNNSTAVCQVIQNTAEKYAQEAQAKAKAYGEQYVGLLFGQDDEETWLARFKQKQSEGLKNICKSFQGYIIVIPESTIYNTYITQQGYSFDPYYVGIQTRLEKHLDEIHEEQQGKQSISMFLPRTPAVGRMKEEQENTHPHALHNVLLCFIALDSRLEDYIKERETEETKYLDFFNRSITKHEGKHQWLSFFHCGFTKDQKIAAAKALQRVLKGEADNSTLTAHLKALQQGRLKKTYSLYLDLYNTQQTILKARPEKIKITSEETNVGLNKRSS